MDLNTNDRSTHTLRIFFSRFLKNDLTEWLLDTLSIIAMEIAIVWVLWDCSSSNTLFYIVWKYSLTCQTMCLVILARGNNQHNYRVFWIPENAKKEICIKPTVFSKYLLSCNQFILQKITAHVWSRCVLQNVNLTRMVKQSKFISSNFQV